MNSSSNVARIRRAFGTVLLCATLGGCYLLESAQGQLDLMRRREPLARVMDRPSTPTAVRAQLRAVNSIRDFASRELGLPDNGSYRRYADVGRPFVVWNVVAAPEFAVEPKRWCYPIVGCVAYRGYFREQHAQDFAARLRGRGFETSVGGVAAYSTLGHFDDPILNTMMGWNDVELAAIVFHELTHQLVYVPDDAPFNEALATTVETEGVRRWLLAQGRGADLDRHVAGEARYRQVVGLLTATRDELRVLYASPLPPAVMRERKQAALAALRERYARLAANWGGRSPFDAWFAAGLNNAYLASIATYYDCVPGFERELAAAGGRLDVFYRRVRALAAQAPALRDAAVCGRS